MATKTRQQFSTRIDIPADSREKLVALLNQSLANAADLASQVKQAHWNVKGAEFYQLHLLFDEIAGEVAGFVDDIAERATALGGYAYGTARMAAENSELPEYPTDAHAGPEHVEALSERLAAFGAHVRAAIDSADELEDIATADLYTQMARTIDKRLWFLEAHLQK